MKKRAVAVFMAALIGLSATACGSPKQTEDVNTVSVSGILPESGDVIVTNTYIGTVSPQQSITVYPMASGNVQEVSASVGKEVKQGDVLFQLDSAEADREIEEAEEALEKAEKLAKQAEEDAKELEEALEKVEKAEAKAGLEVEIEALEKKVEEYKKSYEAAEKEYKELDSEYTKKYSSWTDTEKVAKKETVSMAKKVMDQAKSFYDAANTELTALKKELSSASSSTSTSGSKTSSTKTSSSSTTSSSKTSSSSTSSDSKDSDSKKGDNDTEKKTEVTVETTVYDQMVQDAEKAVEEAKAKLEFYQVTAPIDGTIEAVYIATNEKAFEDAASLVISNKSNIEVTFQVPEDAALELKAGDKVTVEKNGAMNEATITEIALMADEQTKLFTVKASLGAVDGFSTGTDVKVYADTKKEQGVLRIPYDALYFQRGTAYVYCAEDDEAVRREVQVGLMNDEYAQILDGLTEEDIVISTWSSQLKDGADIHLLFVIGGNSAVEEEEETEDALTEDENTEDIETEGADTDSTEEEYKWQLPDLD